MERKRIKLLIEVDLDPIPGSCHTAFDWQNFYRIANRPLRQFLVVWTGRNGRNQTIVCTTDNLDMHLRRVEAEGCRPEGKNAIEHSTRINQGKLL